MVPLQSSESEPSSKLSSSSSLQLPSPLEFYFLTLFPELFPGVLQSSLLGKAQEKGLVSYYPIQMRDFSQDKHKAVDDHPYGGGEGMLLKAEVLHAAWKSIVDRPSRSGEKTLTVLLSPQGVPFQQEMAREFTEYSKLILVCGHYEGVDERFIDLCVDREVSIGDYVMTGGELPALVIADTVTRLIPGVVGNQQSITQDSLENGLLKYPQYTRPREFGGLKVPDVLLSGDHEQIRLWREKQMRERTQQKRPDLWEAYRRK